MITFNSIKLPTISSNRLIATIIPALLITVVTIYIVSIKTTELVKVDAIPGKPLAAFEEFYPVQSDNDGHLFLNKTRFVNAITYLTKTPSPKAIADLIYLGQANNVSMLLSDQEKSSYMKLMDNPVFTELREKNKQRDNIFQVYKDIVNGIGQTFAGTGVEIVLHDTRNPLQSVVAIQNPISGRRIGDTNTNFGLELIKNYSLVDKQGASFVAYPLKLKDGRQIKSTTVPLYDYAYGLVGFICLNIDISMLDSQKNPQVVLDFIENFKLINSNPKVSELIENSKRMKAVTEDAKG